MGAVDEDGVGRQLTGELYMELGGGVIEVYLVGLHEVALLTIVEEVGR